MDVTIQDVERWFSGILSPPPPPTFEAWPFRVAGGLLTMIVDALKAAYWLGVKDTLFLCVPVVVVVAVAFFVIGGVLTTWVYSMLGLFHHEPTPQSLVHVVDRHPDLPGPDPGMGRPDGDGQWPDLPRG